MTGKELALALGYGTANEMLECVVEKDRRFPNMPVKPCSDRYNDMIFSREDVEWLCRNFEPPLNEIQISLAMEKYTESSPPPPDSNRWIKGTAEFIERARKYRHVKACANCSYCAKKSRKGLYSKMFPYCRFFRKFIVNIKVPVKHKNWNGKVIVTQRSADIFTDRCNSWNRGDVVIFHKD